MSVDPEQPPVEHGSGAPEAVPTPPQENWEQRYKDTQTWGQTAHETIKALRENPTQLIEFIKEHQPDMLAEEPDYDPDLYEPEGEPQVNDTPADPRLDKHDEWIAKQEAKAAEEQYQKDLQTAAGERELSQEARDFIQYRTIVNGNNTEALNNAVKAWVEFEDSLKPAKPAPPAPHVPGGPGAPADGESPTGSEQRVAAMTAAHRAHESGS